MSSDADVPLIKKIKKKEGVSAPSSGLKLANDIIVLAFLVFGYEREMRELKEISVTHLI